MKLTNEELLPTYELLKEFLTRRGHWGDFLKNVWDGNVDSRKGNLTEYIFRDLKHNPRNVISSLFTWTLAEFPIEFENRSRGHVWVKLSTEWYELYAQWEKEVLNGNK